MAGPQFKERRSPERGGVVVTFSQLTEEEVAAFGGRLDTFAAQLTQPEKEFLTTILKDAEVAQQDDIDHRTPGDIAVAIYRTYRSPAITLNPQPIPPALPLIAEAQGDGR